MRQPVVNAVGAIVLCLAIVAPTPAQAFFTAKKAAAVPKVDPALVEEALAVYAKKYPNVSKTKTRPFFSSWGVPGKDVDGTAIKTGAGGTTMGKALLDVDVTRQKTAFATLAKLYGPEEALAMTKALPAALAFDSTYFADSLAAFAEIFGEDEAKAMIGRNPGLLAVKPAAAAKSDNQTMQFSYIVGATRPLGPVLLPGLFALLAVPGIESSTGIPIRATFFAALTGGSVGEATASLQQIASFATPLN